MKAFSSRCRLLVWLGFLSAIIALTFVLIFNPLTQASQQAQSGTSPTIQSYMPVVSKAAVDSFTLIDWDLGAGLVTNDQAAENKVYALFNSPLLPSKYQSNVPIDREGTDSFIEAVTNWD